MRDTNTAENSDAKIPMVSVTANPLSGPVPNWKSTTAAMRVVMFVSIIVTNARLKPASTAERMVLPLVSSSLMRS